MFKKLIICLISAILLVSCGGTTVKVRQSSDGVNATVSVTTNNPTNVEVTPSISVDVGELNEVLDSLKNLSSEPLSFDFDKNGELTINLDQLCKSVKPALLPAILTSSEFPSIRSYILTQNHRYLPLIFSIEKMQNFNSNLCANPVAIVNSMSSHSH